MRSARPKFEAPAIELWRRIPAVVRRLMAVQLGALLAFAFVGVSMGPELTGKGLQNISFAKPALASGPRWEERVADFGNRMTRAWGVRPETAHEFSAWILEASTRQKLEPELIASLILTESHFRKNVRSYYGAVGPAQVRPEYWSDFCGVADLTDPEQNVYCGAQILAYYRERCGAERCALSAYNTGLKGMRGVHRQAGLRYVSKVGDQLAKFALL
ncbi:MAG: lytic transglycosylase domain-containing protein [Pseudomonadales bacterium]|mgnify:CR=1 FL=1|nr:lytic transglycosylase domain-containing protein [Pseudomonadales bacterium]MDP6825703.1 lytic transglycosylase domain-containing protein [Pseudomonadales bacterium]